MLVNNSVGAVFINLKTRNLLVAYGLSNGGWRVFSVLMHKQCSLLVIITLSFFLGHFNLCRTYSVHSMVLPVNNDRWGGGQTLV